MILPLTQRLNNRQRLLRRPIRIEMAKKFHAAANRGEALRLTDDEVRFYDSLAENESAVHELSDESLKKIAHELTKNVHKNLSVDWSERESVRAKLRLMVKRILRKYKYPSDQQESVSSLRRNSHGWGDCGYSAYML